MLWAVQCRPLIANQPSQNIRNVAEEIDDQCLMETAPWRVARRWAAPATSSGERPARITHSARSSPTSSRRDMPSEGPTRPTLPEEGPPGHRTGEDEGPTPAQILTEEDVEKLQDEEAMQMDTAAALASHDNACRRESNLLPGTFAASEDCCPVDPSLD